MDVSALGAPVTDIDDFIAGRSQPGCRSEPAHAATPPTPEVDGTPRHSRGVRIVAVSVVAVLAVVAAWALGRGAAAAPLPPSPTGPPVGLTGFAELYVAAYLSGSADAAGFVADVDDIEWPRHLARYVARTESLGAYEIAPSYWSVTVGAEVMHQTNGGYGPGRLEYYDVAIAMSPAGLIATAAPFPVDPPPKAVPPGVYADLRTQSDDAILALVTDFAGAYFARQGHLARTITATSTIDPMTTPYRGVDVLEVRIGDVGGETWATAPVILKEANGQELSTSLTVRISGTGTTARIAALLPGLPPAPVADTPVVEGTP